MTALDQFKAELAYKLDETSPEFIKTLNYMIDKRSPKVANIAYYLARDMYEAGAMISDGSRRRTLGGCFILCWDKAKKLAKLGEVA